MAHGSKKWIVRYDGKVKRSNNRTKLDYYGELAKYQWWTPMEPTRRKYGRRQYRVEFCPQCKHKLKDIDAHNRRYQDAYDALMREWYEVHKNAVAQYEKDLTKWNQGWLSWEFRPIDPFNSYRSPIRFLRYLHENEDRLPPRPIYDEETWLCPKHRFMFDTREAMWHVTYLPGHKKNYGWMIKNEYREYRAEVKNLMQKAKYDEEYYDKIPPKSVHGWLD